MVICAYNSNFCQIIDPNNAVVNGENALHAAFRVSFGTDVTEMVKLLVERYALVLRSLVTVCI